jgi:glycerophosphoryl diester phosphodiesterase
LSDFVNEPAQTDGQAVNRGVSAMGEIDPWRRIPPIGFAHRGDRANAPDNTIVAFSLALEKGATALESDVWVTVDGEAVLDHDGLVRTTLRKRSIKEYRRAELPAHVPTLSEVFDLCGTDVEVSLDLKDHHALDAVLASVRNAGRPDRLWVCSHDWEFLSAQRGRAHDVRLVDSTRLKRLKDGPERHAARIASAGIDAINMHHTDWTIGLTTLFHRFERTCFGWDAQQERVLTDLANMEMDGVFCDDTERMVRVLAGLG